ncbi:hypothetical protein [Shouchella shacheensis]|uniref:hypothetical protein n=1 Tax=Shouchella shacheensis TaxID=1649580 RepID=UPI0012F999E4|nr:hypothetical protein [Shouchella shacheensis]
MKKPRASGCRSWIRKSGGALLTSDKFWSDGRIKPGLGLIWRREETSSEWVPQLDQEKRRCPAHERQVLERRQYQAWSWLDLAA